MKLVSRSLIVLSTLVLVLPAFTREVASYTKGYAVAIDVARNVNTGGAGTSVSKTGESKSDTVRAMAAGRDGSVYAAGDVDEHRGRRRLSSVVGRCQRDSDPVTTTDGGTNMRRLSLQLAASCVALISALPLAGPARAQYSENVLYSFSGQPDAASPVNYLTADSNGNLYGTAASGGAYNAGAVLELIPPTVGVGPWTETVHFTHSLIEANS